MVPDLSCSTSSNDEQGLSKQQASLHMDKHAAALTCVAVACTGLDDSARALETLDSSGSSGNPAAIKLDQEALLQSLIRHPLSQVVLLVGHHGSAVVIQKIDAWVQSASP